MIQPRDVPHPGMILKEEFLEEGGLTQAALAKRLGWTTTKLNQVVRGKRAISADSALDLARAYKTSPQFWMNLQTMYDVDRALLERSHKVSKKKKVALAA